MLDFLISHPEFMMISVILSLAVAIAMIVGIFLSELQRGRMDPATRLSDIRERLAVAREELQRKEASLLETNRKIEERDRVVAEIGAIEDRLSALRLELSGLADAQRQIEETKQAAANAATELAIGQDRLAAARSDLELIIDRVKHHKAEHARLQEEIERRKIELGQLPEALKKTIEGLKSVIGNLETSKTRLEDELQTLRNERNLLMAERTEYIELVSRKSALSDEKGRLDAEIKTRQSELAVISSSKSSLSVELANIRQELFSTKQLLKYNGEEAQSLTARKEALKIELEQLPAELKNKTEDLNAAIKNLEIIKTALNEELQILRTERGLLVAEQTGYVELITRKSTLAGEIERMADNAQKVRGDIDEIIVQKDAKAVELANRLQELHGTKQILKANNEEIQSLAVRKEVLEQDVKKLNGQAGGTSGNSEDMLADLERPPMPLETALITKPAAQNEKEAIDDVRDYLKKLKLSYDRRTVAAFHTALKINDNAQLTVLAGVSGTGKSLLPRRYAEAMGIKFLPIAVEPRWDSPQDLLGFYNYIERRFRATDLARSLVQMDPYNTSGLSTGKYNDHMMLVLLDEMNLARVEYYLSEFLSRLEARPEFASVSDKHKRADSNIPIDIRGRLEGPVKLFPSHNMLFVGTMNDDESTQSLSDKVLDRSNIMQFSAPDSFPKQEKSIEVPSNKSHRSFAQWRRWIKHSDQLDGAKKQKAERVIKELAQVMEACSRPFGHRLNSAMLSYIANYLSGGNKGEDLEEAMADQIEFRILPKLRGIPINDHDVVFKSLRTLISHELGDTSFAERLEKIVEQQRDAGGLFNWRGYTRNSDGLPS